MTGNTQASRGRLLAPVIALTALPLFLAADTAIALLRGWHARSEPQSYVWAISAVMCGTVVLGLITRRGRAWIRSRAAKLTLLGVTVALVCLLVEGAWHVAMGPPDFWFHRRTPNQQREYRPAPGLLAGVTGPSYYRTNEHGIRGPTLPPSDRALRVLCVGGSTAECLYLDDTEAWPQLLMDRLQAPGADTGVWVGNAGKSAYSSSDHVQYLETTSFLRQLDCLVAYVGANDLGFAILGRAIRATSDKAPLWMGSHILHTIRRVAETGGGISRHRQVEDGSQYEVLRARRKQMPQVDSIPDLKPALRDYAENLRRMIAACRRHGVRLVLMTQAVLWSETLSPEQEARLWMGVSHRGAVAPGVLRHAMDQFNETLREVAAEADVEVVDTAVLSGRADCFYDDMHLSEAGAEAVAELLAAHFEEKPLARAAR